jgi:hypothetical protein
VHVVEEDGVALPQIKPHLVRQVPLIGRAEDVDRDEILLQLAQALLGLLDRQARDEAQRDATRCGVSREGSTPQAAGAAH